MSSTTGFQNLLVNVFRPVYRYETPPGDSNTIFIPKVEMSNVDTYSGNSISVFTAAVGDASSNVYVGSNAGNPYTTVKNCAYVSAFGYSAAAGASNVSNSVFLGYNAGTGATDVSSSVIIGANAGAGSSNVRIGYSNAGAGNGNVSVGASSTTSTYSNCILLGTGITATQNNQFRVASSYIWGDSSNKWLGLGTSASIYADSNSKFDVSGNATVKGQVGINMLPIRTLDVNGNFRASDAFGTLDFSNGVTSSSNGFASTRGTTTVSGGATTIGTLKKGTVLISAVNTTTSSKHAARHVLAYTTSNTDDLASNVSGGSVSITFSSSDIQITDASNGTYDWTITYFPL
jgi:hypothetical protein